MTSPDLIGKQLRHISKSAASFLARHNPACAKTPLRASLMIGAATLVTPLAVAALLVLTPSGPGSTATDVPEQHLARVQRSLEIRLPDLRSQMESIGKKDDSVMHETYVTSSDTLRSLLSRLGIRDADAAVFIEKKAAARALLSPQPGQYVTASTLESGGLVSLRLYIDDDTTPKVLEVARDPSGLTVSEKPFSYDVQLVMAEGTVRGLPSTSLQKSNIPTAVIAQMHAAFDYDRDVVNNLAQGEAFRVIYESKYIDGSFVRIGKLLAMQFEKDGKTREFFWFPDDNQGGNYYDSKGTLTRRTFMRVPLDVQKVSSEFAPLRRHPITGVLRPHRGTDFRAPWGATVRAAADGKVVFAGLGTGYGKYIRIQHGPDCQTVYAHLSSIAPNIRVGSDVYHGEQIGKVGQTGLATGPHLHYELIMSGTQINPMTAKLPDTKTLSAYRIAKMEARIAPLQEKLSLLRRVQVSGAKPNESTRTR